MQLQLSALYQQILLIKQKQFLIAFSLNRCSVVISFFFLFWGGGGGMGGL